jgi:hypothetical protein
MEMKNMSNEVWDAIDEYEGSLKNARSKIFDDRLAHTTSSYEIIDKIDEHHGRR